jgi:uroporphyrinogen-III synthase
MTVIVTRPQPDADFFAADCRAAGLDPIVAPLMTVRFRDTIALPERLGALAFTSANGVRAFAAQYALRTLPIFCVGQASAAAARDCGFQTVTPSGGDVDALAHTIIQAAASLDGPVVHVAGSERAGDLIALLSKAHVAAERIVAYEARPTDALPEPAAEALRNGAPDVALFSPRTARLFLQLTEQAGMTQAAKKCRAICLSEAVATAASGHHWKQVLIAKERNSAAMIAAMTKRA